MKGSQFLQQVFTEFREFFKIFFHKSSSQLLFLLLYGWGNENAETKWLNLDHITVSNGHRFDALNSFCYGIF